MTAENFYPQELKNALTALTGKSNAWHAACSEQAQPLAPFLARIARMALTKLYAEEVTAALHEVWKYLQEPVRPWGQEPEDRKSAVYEKYDAVWAHIAHLADNEEGDPDDPLTTVEDNIQSYRSLVNELANTEAPFHNDPDGYIDADLPARFMWQIIHALLTGNWAKAHALNQQAIYFDDALSRHLSEPYKRVQAYMDHYVYSYQSLNYIGGIPITTHMQYDVLRHSIAGHIPQIYIELGFPGMRPRSPSIN